MITLRVWFALIALSTVVAGGTVWTAMARPATAFGLDEPTTAVTDLLRAYPEPAPARIDIYGNEIVEAVGDYRIDPFGGTYENHSPDTEVPRLTAPVL